MTWDITKDRKELYKPSAKHPSLVEVPVQEFLMLDGTGDPNGSALYSEVVSSLYATAYTLKFSLKKDAPERDFKVAPLEGLWWADDMELFQSHYEDKSGWIWTMMMAMPPGLAQAELDAAKAEAKRKRGLAAIDWVRLESYEEGLAVQMMHIGPYSEEGPNIKRTHEFAAAEGYILRGKHHEIYLSDPNRTAQERMKTIIRQPIAPA